MKRIAKFTPGSAALEEVKDLDFVVKTYFDEGLERYGANVTALENLRLLVLVMDSEGSAKLAALLLVQLLFAWIRFDPPHNHALHVKGGINHAGLRGLHFF